MNKFILYLFVLPLVIYTMDSVNFNSIFKKNKVFQARIFYILVMFSLSYLVCNFLYDFLNIIKYKLLYYENASKDIKVSCR